MNDDYLSKCLEILNEIGDKFNLQTSIQVQCGKAGGIIIFIQGLQSIGFNSCEKFLKCQDTIIQCLEMQNSISNMNDEMNKLIMSMR